MSKAKDDEKAKEDLVEPASLPEPEPPKEPDPPPPESAPPPSGSKPKKKEEVRRHPLEWAELLGIHPDILGTFRHPVRAAGEVPAGINAAVVAGASIHHGWSKMRGKVHEKVLGIAVTKSEFYLLVNEWRFAPSPGTASRHLLFKRRVKGLKVLHGVLDEEEKKEVTHG